MNTIDEGATSEKSALGRIVVWRWTLDYVAKRPFFGGGFYAYLANAGVLHRYQKGEESEISQKGGKAFHNVFFEVLGETGYGGLVLFLGIILHTLMLNRAMSKKIKRNKNPTKEWIGSMCSSVNMSLMVYCVGGMFIGVAFYPWIYYLYGLSVSFTHLERQNL
jgi:O-antigen ligase